MRQRNGKNWKGTQCLLERMGTDRWTVYPPKWGKAELMGYMCTSVSTCGGRNVQKCLSEIGKYYSSSAVSEEGEESAVSLRMRKWVRIMQTSGKWMGWGKGGRICSQPAPKAPVSAGAVPECKGEEEMKQKPEIQFFSGPILQRAESIGMSEN